MKQRKIIESIASTLSHISKDTLSTAERNIINLLVDNGYGYWQDYEDDEAYFRTGKPLATEKA